MTQSAAFAVGDRVVARRNDRRLGVVNGDVGRLVAIDGSRLTIALDTGRRVEVPDRYARDGHLQHGYALTAHLAQGSTVDRAFVLGSDELYREWGDTALSRHRVEARFYVSASREFLNQTAEPLNAAGQVARVLSTSRAQRAAVNATGATTMRERRERELRDMLEEIDGRLGDLRRQRADVPWHRRARRRQLDLVAAGWERGRARTREEIDRLSREPGARPERVMPRLQRATDPLAALEPERDRSRTRGRDRGIDGRER